MGNLAPLANPNISQHTYMAPLGLKVLPNTPQSLTPQRFQRFCQGGQVFSTIRREKHPVFAKAAKCECLGILVIIFEKMEQKMIAENQKKAGKKKLVKSPIRPPVRPVPRPIIPKR